VTTAAHALFEGLVDYAGLFPPAGLGMDAAVAEAARWRASAASAMLGRFVCPAPRLDELAHALLRLPGPAAHSPWRVSALVGDDPQADLSRVERFQAAHDETALVDAVELRAGTPAEIERQLGAVPPGLPAYVELPLSDALDDALAVLAARGGRAKVRCGCVFPEAIPSAGELARFVARAAGARVPFKATAGLHHALRGERPLTYAPDSPRATMHGFLNLLAAAALAPCATEPELEAVLLATDATRVGLDAEGLRFGDRRIAAPELEACRRERFLSFGSCSIAEPVAELRALGMVA
jgi:hypothetical protein